MGGQVLTAVAALVGLAAVSAGIVLLTRGVDLYRTRQAFRRIGVTPTGAVGAGVSVKLVGTAETTDSTVTGAYSGRDAVCVRYTVAAYRNRGSTRNSDWDRLHEESRQTVFALSDDTGAVNVRPDPESLEFDTGRATDIVVEAGEQPPERVRASVDGVDGLGTLDDVMDGSRSVRRRYRETAIRPGDRILVYGQAIRDPAGQWGDRLTIVPGAEDLGIVTNRSEQSLLREDDDEILLSLLLGLLLVIVPLGLGAGLLVTLGGP